MQDGTTMRLTENPGQPLPLLSVAGEGAADNSASLPPRVDGYIIASELGHGGMGRVWRARQLSTRRDVALKMMHEWMGWSARARQRFEREIELAARLDHPNIAAVYDSGLHQGLYYYAMQLVEGEPLVDYVENAGLSERATLELFRKICDAVQFAHRHQVLHRDLKPSNILVTADGHPVVLDFGLAKGLGDPAFAQPETPAGTPVYMSPEQAGGRAEQIDTRSDVYSLGVILYRLTTKGYPHDPSGTESQLRQRIVTQPIVRPRARNRRYHRELEAVVLKALQKDPEQRYGSPGELGDDLQRYLHGEPLIARRATVAYVLARRLRKHRVAVGIGCAILALLIGTAAYGYVRVTIAEWRANRTLARLHVRSGVHAAERGDHSGSLVWFTEAMRVQPDRAQGYIDRVRLGAAFRRAPAVIKQWGDRRAPIVDAALGPEGLTVVTADPDGSVNLWDASTGDHHADPITHGTPIDSVTFSPGGAGVVALRAGTRVHIFNIKNGRAIGEPLEHNAVVQTLSFSNDGRLLATATGRQAFVWDVLSGRRMAGPLRHLGAVRRIGFDTDNRRLVTASHDGTARVWDVATGKPTAGPLRHPGFQGVSFGVNDAAFTPDGRYVLSAGGDRAVLVWNAATGAQVGLPLPHTAAVNRLSISRDGRYLLTACADGTARVWHIADRTLRASMLAHSGPIGTADFDRAGRVVVTSSSDGTVRVWPWALDPPATTVIRHGAPVVRAIPSPDGRRILSVGADATARLWELPGDNPLVHDAAVGHVAIDPAGRTLAVGTRVGSVYLWDLQHPTLPPTVFSHPDGEPVRRVRFNWDGTLLASASWDRTVRIWDTSGAPGGAIAVLPHAGEVHDVRFSNDATRLACGEVGRVTVWDARTWTMSGAQRVIDGVVDQVRFAPDGRTMAAVTSKQARAWYTVSGKQVGRPLRFGVVAAGAAFSLDARHFVTLGLDPSIGSIDGATGPGLLRQIPAGSTYDASFSPDSRFVATAGWGSARVWDTRTDKASTPPLTHHGKVYAAKFSPDGRLIVTCGGDKTARVWDAQTGDPVTAPLTHRAPVSDATFSADGHTLATVAAETVHLWDLSPAEDDLQTLIDRTRRLSGHTIDASGAFVPITSVSTDASPIDQYRPIPQ